MSRKRERTYIGANGSLDRLLVLKQRVLESVHNFRQHELVLFELNRVFETVPEGGEARLVLILVLVEENSLSAANAVVHADILDPPELACERSLSARVLRNIELMWGQLFLELFQIGLNATLFPCLEDLVAFESSHFSLLGLGVLVNLMDNHSVFLLLHQVKFVVERPHVVVS